MSERALVVFTAKNTETIVKDGGTQGWALDPGVVRNYKYAVCTRNARRKEDTGTGPRGPEPHRAAFLVGRISDVEKVGQRNGRDRYLVRFDAVARVDVPAVWDGSRNPVRYVNVADLKAKGIDFDRLKFQPLKMPAAKPSRAASIRNPTFEIQPLSIVQAKQCLAATFGVPVDAIEITIRG